MNCAENRKFLFCLSLWNSYGKVAAYRSASSGHTHTQNVQIHCSVCRNRIIIANIHITLSSYFHFLFSFIKRWLPPVDFANNANRVSVQFVYSFLLLMDFHVWRSFDYMQILRFFCSMFCAILRFHNQVEINNKNKRSHFHLLLRSFLVRPFRCCRRCCCCRPLQ